ncbi:MAG TPA: efflux RND transporter permease subunit [Xanthobacteraceae bacterium]|nr:efflux RND transporter permease subunit [Xanthobacteraceae bacterium]
MNVSAPFIIRPIATTLLTIGLTLLGIVSYFVLPIAGVPQVDVPTIRIEAKLPGANAETMATSVATPLEGQLSLIAGVTSISSASSLGVSQIQVEFDLSRSIEGAAQDVQTAISAAGGLLPKNLPNPPTYEKVNPADALLMSIAVTSDDLPIAKVDEYVENFLAPQISRITGVGLVDFHGQQKPAIRVQINPAAAAAIGITLEDVRAALGTATVNSPKGTLDGPKQSLTLDTTDQIFDATTFDDAIVTYRNGAPVRVRDLGRAINGVESTREAAWLGGRRAVIIDVHKQPGYNINQTVQRVKDALPDLQRPLPPSITLQIMGDRTQTIRASVIDVQITMAISIGLVVLVTFLFLRHLWATLIPSVTIPVSLLTTCAVMYLAGYTLDNVSLMALTIAVGFIIDDAVVMIENIMRHIEAGERPLQAALAGSREIGFTIVSMTLSLTAVFIPLLLMGGLIGRLFREFAVTVSMAIIVSGVVSLTLSPMMCGWLLRSHQSSHKENRILAALERGFQVTLGWYAASLRWSLRHRLFIMSLMAATMAATVYLYAAIPKGFFPQQDNGLIQGTTEAAQDISYAAMVERVHELAKVVTADPDVGTVYYWVGANPTVNTGRLQIDLKPIAERKATATDVINRLRRATLVVPGIALFGQARQDVQIGARVSKTQFQYTLQDPNVAELFQWAPVMLAKLAALPQLQDVTGDLQATAPRMMLKIDRDAIGRFGITPQAIDDTLYDAFGQRQVATIFGQLNQQRVVLEVTPSYQEDASSLQKLYVRSTTTGQLVPLSALTKNEMSVSPLTINHTDQFPSVTLSFNLAPGFSLGDALGAIGSVERSMAKPATLTARFQGSARVFETSLATQPYLIAAAIIAVYLVLGVLYESFIHPITILSTLPSAGVGAFLALMVLHYDFSLIALIGVILLVGIVKKNAIMMIDFALVGERTRNLTSEQSIFEASLMRYRPIMMTTMAALLGGLPLALGTGPGSELRRPLGIAIVGGLLLSQFLTLYTTPVIYIYLSRFVEFFRSVKKGGQQAVSDDDSEAPRLHAAE